MPSFVVRPAVAVVAVVPVARAGEVDAGWGKDISDMLRNEDRSRAAFALEPLTAVAKRT